MKGHILYILVDPDNLNPLTLETLETSGTEEIITGKLISTNGLNYEIRNGIPRFVTTVNLDQLQTSETFGFKWKKRDTYDTPAFREIMIPWIIEMYGFKSLEDMTEHYNSSEIILDIGCGSGFTSSLWMDNTKWNGKSMWIGLDISEAIDVAQERLINIPNTHFVQADALQLPFPDVSFNTVISDGVLHHTPSTREAILSGARVLRPGGEFCFYVYRRKGPIREFTDDYIRDRISSLTNEDAWEMMRSLTKLGQVLTELHANVIIPEDIHLLGIRAGEYDVQRLIYWNFAKLYWNDKLSFEENVHVNFDWYRPKYAHRQSSDEVHSWCSEAGLSIIRFHEQESGFAVRAIKS
jgi:ubiquinone/menaquinone biosynthesis C-methylase UbiE/uncharacterized protein YbaR (Trm112 family)